MPARKPKPWVKFKPKEVSPETLRKFWLRYDKGQGVRKHIHGYRSRERKVMAVSRGVLGTVRRFDSVEKLNRYTRLMEEWSDKLNKTKSTIFAVQPIQILDIDTKNKRIVERVYANPSVYSFISNYRARHYSSLNPRYLERFERRLERKGMDLEEAKNLVSNAYNELKKTFYGLFEPELGSYILAEILPSNTLVLDIDKNTKKVLFALVDIS